MTVGLGVGLAVGAGFRPSAAAAQAGAATVIATARVLPAVGVLPRRVGIFPGSGRAHFDSRDWESHGGPGKDLPSLPATTVTRRVVGNRHVIQLAATGV